MKQIVKPIDGVLHLIAYDQQGRELWSLQQSNQIVNGAYEIAAEALAGLPNAAISKVAAGTNGTAPTENDTSITDPTIVDVQTVEYPRPTPCASTSPLATWTPPESRSPNLGC